ncbi:MAG: DUF1003 domain-containing protein [Bacteroidota bacterium]
MDKHTPMTLAQIRKERKPMRNVIAEQKKSMSRLNIIALWITEHVGTMGFFIIIFIWTAIWLSWNTLASEAYRFDPFPAFVLWLFMSNMIQIFLMPLIMIGQNLQSQHAEARAEADFEINQKSEMEIETILMHLENQNQIMQEILLLLQQKKIPGA